MPKDPELLAIEKIAKILEAFPDKHVRYRIIDYCAKRALPNEDVQVAPPQPKTS